MQIGNDDIRNGKYDGQVVYICDYRLGDKGIHAKPIRNVKPMKVLVRSNKELPKNKKVYYSESHFTKLKSNGGHSSTIIPLFDNTGYRNFTGIALNVFDNIDECIDCFNKQVDIVIQRFEEYKKSILPSIDNSIEELEKLKG